MTVYYKWQCNGERDCWACHLLDGKVMSIDDWEHFIMPGFHLYCDCSLAISHTTFDGFDNISPNDPIFKLLMQKMLNLNWSLYSEVGHIVGSDMGLSPYTVYSTTEPESYVGSTNYFKRVAVGTWSNAPWPPPTGLSEAQAYAGNIRNNVRQPALLPFEPNPSYPDEYRGILKPWFPKIE